MQEDDFVVPKGANAGLADVVRQDLELLGIGELTERIDILHGEIQRSTTMIARKQAGRSAAEALFKSGGDD